MNMRKLAFMFRFSSKCSNSFLFSIKPSIDTSYTIYQRRKPYVLIWFQFFHLFHHFRQQNIWTYSTHLHPYVSNILNDNMFGYVTLGRSSRFQSILFYCEFVCLLDNVVISFSGEILLKLKITKNSVYNSCEH